VIRVTDFLGNIPHKICNVTI